MSAFDFDAILSLKQSKTSATLMRSKQETDACVHKSTSHGVDSNKKAKLRTMILFKDQKAEVMRRQ